MDHRVSVDWRFFIDAMSVCTELGIEALYWGLGIDALYWGWRIGIDDGRHDTTILHLQHCSYLHMSPAA